VRSNPTLEKHTKTGNEVHEPHVLTRGSNKIVASKQIDRTGERISSSKNNQNAKPKKRREPREKDQGQELTARKRNPRRKGKEL